MRSTKKAAWICILLLVIAVIRILNPYKYFKNQVASCNMDYFRNYLPADYPVEAYELITKDGFKLQIFRLQKRGTRIKKGLHPVLLQHGMDNSALSWVMNGKVSLALMLADQGFDVWLGNNRGSRFAREHLDYDQNSEEFWEFSFQQMAEFDLPVIVKKLRDVTGINRFTFIGYSQGASQMLAALSDPEIKNSVTPYVDSFHAIAPAVFLSNTAVSALKLAKWFNWIIHPGRSLIGLRHLELGECEYNPEDIAMHSQSCMGSPSSCNHFWFTDPHRETVNYEVYGNFASSHPGGMSMHSVQHFAQFITQPNEARSFQKYDYGTKRNLKLYGQSTPPVYPLEDIRTRIRIYLGGADLLTHIEDSSEISSRLKSADVEVRIFEKWGHLSFLLPQPEAGTEFYQSIVDDIKSRLDSSHY